MVTQRQVAIVGAGPAGLAAAERLSGRGDVAVAIYERMPSPARKFLIAGRGGLNLTHSEPLDAFLARYRGSLAEDLRADVRAYDPAALVAWCEGLGEPTFVGSSGRVFPKSFKASPLLRAWLRRLEERGVRLVARALWTGFSPDGALVFDTLQGAMRVRADATILALGGASWPRLGSDGAWVDILARAGIPVAPLVPANVGVEIAWSPLFAERFAGTPLKRVAIAREGGGEARVASEAIVTRHGLEGTAIYRLADLPEALAAGPVRLRVDLRPDLDEAALAARIEAGGRKKTLTERLRRAGIPPVGAGLMREAAGAALPEDPAALARLAKAVPLVVSGLRPIERAISSAGGIPAEALVPGTRRLAARDGVFVAGEMLDWAAPTGGYLLQGAFASGVRAAREVEAWLAQERGGEPTPPP